MAADTKSINIKNRTYYFFNDMISIEAFDSNLLKVDKKSYKNNVIYHIGYITIKEIDDYKNIYRVNPLYLIIGKVDGHIEGKNGSKYLVLDSTDKNKEVEKYRELWDGIKKDFMKIKFDTDDDLPLNKPLKLRMLTIIVRSVFKKMVNCIHKFIYEECWYEL